MLPPAGQTYSPGPDYSVLTSFDVTPQEALDLAMFETKGNA